MALFRIPVCAHNLMYLQPSTVPCYMSADPASSPTDAASSASFPFLTQLRLVWAGPVDNPTPQLQLRTPAKVAPESTCPQAWPVAVPDFTPGETVFVALCGPSLQTVCRSNTCCGASTSEAMPANVTAAAGGAGGLVPVSSAAGPVASTRAVYVCTGDALACRVGACRLLYVRTRGRDKGEAVPFLWVCLSGWLGTCMPHCWLRTRVESATTAYVGSRSGTAGQRAMGCTDSTRYRTDVGQENGADIGCVVLWRELRAWHRAQARRCGKHAMF